MIGTGRGAANSSTGAAWATPTISTVGITVNKLAGISRVSGVHWAQLAPAPRVGQSSTDFPGLAESIDF